MDEDATLLTSPGLDAFGLGGLGNSHVLILAAEGEPERRIPLGNEPIVVGRLPPCALVLPGGSVSRQHCRFRIAGGNAEVADLGSTNGTYVDGTRIAEPTLLGGGAQIKIGTTVLVVEGVLPVSDPSADLAGVHARNVTRVSPAVTSVGAPQAAATQTAEAPPTAPTGAPAPPFASPPFASPPSQPIGEFHPPRQRRQRGLASRSWVPVALSFGTVILVAIALVIYFSQHT